MKPKLKGFAYSLCVVFDVRSTPIYVLYLEFIDLMLTKSQQKYVLSLHQKKYRKLNGVFIVEGRKNVAELLTSDFKTVTIFSTSAFLDSSPFISEEVEVNIVSEKELDKISTLKTSDHVLAIVEQKENESIVGGYGEFVLVLDDVRDPGNFGTIVRIADWYGISKIICSVNTVEFYNPKVIMSSMGSFTRVAVFFTDLEKYFKVVNPKKVYGAYLEGTSVYNLEETNWGYLLMGSESHGISKNLEKCVTDKITIPRKGEAESLNVAISTAILLDNFLKGK